MLNGILDPIRASFSGAAAKDDVAAIIRFHRIQASPGYRQAAEYVLRQLHEAGVQAKMEQYAADFQSRYWTMHSFQEWACDGATLTLLEPERKLADYREVKLSIIQRSAPFSGEAEVVVLPDELDGLDLAKLDLAGKVVLTRSSIGRVKPLAVEQGGAVGILFDGLMKAPPVREAVDLPDERQYTSFWWSGAPDEKYCFGFVLTPRQGIWLREQAAKREAKGQPPLKIRAEVQSRLYDGAFEVIEAEIPGQSDEVVIIVSHLCHPQPSANDNASGVAANLETARTLQRLIDSGRLARPRRTIRFLWMPEMSGSQAYLCRHEAEIPRLIAGLNLDMVGEDQDQTGSVMLIERPPQAMASFAPELAEAIREALLDDVTSYTGLGSYGLFRFATTEFSGGSDHYVFSDPNIGVPMPMVIQWPDKFYHTTADTLDKVSPASLARAGALAGSYAYFIANAGPKETLWLAHEMDSRFRRGFNRQMQGYLQDGLPQDVDQRSAYNLERQQAALATLQRLSAEKETADLIDRLGESAAEYVAAELARVRAAAAVLDKLPPEAEVEALREAPEWAQRAARLIPRRLQPGPGFSFGSMNVLPPARQEQYRQTLDQRPPWSYTITVLAEYWADGRRTLAEIIEQVYLETGIRDGELLLFYFDVLQETGAVAYDEVTDD